ncbi:3-hydroxybutyryl-CoA dehydrogenase [Amorphus orientalis]|uniref:L-gulonate 3-dehydrogenase n=1 Tax=Amorphus orientalis TaxID=649198 RepID=A0AAE3VMS2_9HYPH|nr:3-hydroxybutyryl-CoA dehydrogenase [Amorphus orientalis]MDQ0315354.1 3-hydroxybutyryl-CoA dehydrogenase [Amorphus orientalis]
MAPRICAVGAGRMGRGIAHVFAYAGSEVTLLDAKDRPEADFERLRSEALADIRAALSMLAELGLFEPSAIDRILERIRVCRRSEADQALAGASFVFEGVPEVKEAKAEAFALVDPHLAEGAVVASTTSTFLVDDLIDMVSRPDRFLNAHWLNPAYLIPLVELMPSERTAEAATAALEALLSEIGKVPVRLKASPGYIVPRTQTLVMNEAARMAEEGVASPEDIDKALIYGMGFRFAVLGALEFIDWGGNDILYYASRYMTGATGAERFKAPDIIDRNMQEGRNGLRDGQGFFDYRDRDVDAYRKERLGRLLDQLRLLDLARPPA